MPYDITLEMVDYADGECLQTLVVRKDLYGPTEATLLAKSYERLLKAFVANPALCLDQPDLFEPTEVQEVMKFSRGKSLFSFSSVFLVMGRNADMRSHDRSVKAIPVA